MFCAKCGSEINDKAAVCIHCGVRVPRDAGDGHIGIMWIISFLFPLIGLIAYLVWVDSSHAKAKSAGSATLWGIAANIIVWIIFIAAAASS